MRRLSNVEMERALSAILPESIKMKNSQIPGLEKIQELAQYDLARGMMNHEKYCLVESITTEEDVVEQSNVIPSNLDNLLLTASLAAYQKSKQKDHLGDILFSIPPFSFAYPLLLSYHLVLNHVSCNLINNDTYKFQAGSGILIITDNIELLSHIWRTNINNNFLSEFLPVFTLEAGSFKKFNFNSEKSKKKDKVNKFDGTLPWLTMFRAYRTNFPEKLEHQPEVIIIDLLPLRHRKRAKTLIEWARDHSKHTIVIAPSHDRVISEIRDSFSHHIPINKTSIRQLENYFYIDGNRTINPITASWTIQSSLPYVRLKDKTIHVIKSKTTTNDFFSAIKMVNEIMKSAKTRTGGMPLSFKKLQQMLIKLLNICIPLEWYERARWARDEPTLVELINRWSKIPPNDKEEAIIYDSLMPHLHQKITEIYGFMMELKMSVRSQLLLKALENKVDGEANVTIIVADQIDQDEFKVWLNAINFTDKNKLAAINVICQKEWAEQQWKEIYFTQKKESNLIIIACPWNQKYLSSFYCEEETQLIVIDAFLEMNLLKYQANQISKADGVRDLWNSLNALFSTNIDVYETNPFYFNFNIEDKPVMFIKPDAAQQREKSDVAIGELFTDQVLLNMFSNEDEIEEEAMPLSEVQLKYDVDVVNNTLFIECIKIINQNENIFYIPTDMSLKVKKFNQTEIQSISPFELKKNDIWVRVKEKKKRELFEEILKHASNTLLMKWINTNINEWRLMVKEVWQKYYSPGKYKKHIFEDIQKDINLNGGRVESHLTIANWINGGLVRSIHNLNAFANITGEERFQKRVKFIHKSMQELWGIHIKLGRSLGKLIEENVNKNLNIKQPFDESQWINLGKDIVIPVDDVLNTIELIDICSVVNGDIYLVHPSLSEREINKDLHDILMKRGMVKHG